MVFVVFLLEVFQSIILTRFTFATFVSGSYNTKILSYLHVTGLCDAVLGGIGRPWFL